MRKNISTPTTAKGIGWRGLCEIRTRIMDKARKEVNIGRSREGLDTEKTVFE